jgi:hypothetical protein
LYPEEEEEEASIFKQNKILLRNECSKVLISDLNFLNFIAAFHSKSSDKVLTTDIFKKYFEGQNYVFIIFLRRWDMNFRL